MNHLLYFLIKIIFFLITKDKWDIHINQQIYINGPIHLNTLITKIQGAIFLLELEELLLISGAYGRLLVMLSYYILVCFVNCSESGD